MSVRQVECRIVVIAVAAFETNFDAGVEGLDCCVRVLADKDLQISYS